MARHRLTQPASLLLFFGCNSMFFCEGCRNSVFVVLLFDHTAWRKVVRLRLTAPAVESPDRISARFLCRCISCLILDVVLIASSLLILTLWSTVIVFLFHGLDSSEFARLPHHCMVIGGTAPPHQTCSQRGEPLLVELSQVWGVVFFVLFLL